MAAIEKTDRQQAIHTRHMAALQAGRYAKLMEARKVEWTGTQTPEWHRYIDAQGKYTTYAQIVSNLTALLDNQTYGWSSRNVGFSGYDDLEISGDWVADLNSNGEEMCLDCARKALMAGELGPDDLHVCYSHIQDYEHAIYCDDCKALIRLGQDCLMVVAVPERFANKNPQKWDRYDRFQYGCGPAMRVREYQDGEQDDAISHAKELALDPEYADVVVQVRYMCPSGDSYNNEVIYDSRHPEA